MEPRLTEDRHPVVTAARTTRQFRAEREGLLLLLTGTAALYLWNLDVSGWANSYYSAAAQAGAESWKAFFFGSLDVGNAITVDKTPLSLWAMALSVRFFGMSSWSILVPQALAGVGAVWLLFASVRHTTRSAGAGLLAGALFAVTPVAALMFRYNNPDAMLTILLVGAGYATLRSLDSPRALRWLVLAGSLAGLGFLTKMFEAFLVLPALALTYAVFAAVPFRTRVSHLVAALGAVLVSAGWWVVVVELWPAGSRPYIGGSTNNSVLQLALGYNGLGRITGNQTTSFSNTILSAANIARISRTDIAGEI
ncbi:MAG: glycosyl transferase, partial [Nocardioides sp.]|nr:glycosyl transferase [Nocardioides sp.]